MGLTENWGERRNELPSHFSPPPPPPFVFPPQSSSAPGSPRMINPRVLCKLPRIFRPLRSGNTQALHPFGGSPQCPPPPPPHPNPTLAKLSPAQQVKTYSESSSLRNLQRCKSSLVQLSESDPCSYQSNGRYSSRHRSDDNMVSSTARLVLTVPATSSAGPGN